MNVCDAQEDTIGKHWHCVLHGCFKIEKLGLPVLFG
jgi:hypothetical protein